VLAQGVSKHTPLAIGTATIVISFAVMLAWIPLRQAPGIGTVLNAVLIGVAIDVMLPLLPGPGGYAGDSRSYSAESRSCRSGVAST
jgi:uncharacterized membrane protein YczE